MKTYNSTWFLVSKLVWLLTIWVAGLGLTRPAAAQSVNVTLNILPPYSPYYADYSGTNAGKVLLLVQNMTDATQKIKLVGMIKGDNGVMIATKANYVPMQPIILNPHEVRQLNGLALKDVLNLNNLNVTGADKTKLVQSSRIPEGNYTFCVQASDYTTNALLSASAPLGCTTFSISYPEPPILINPMKGDQVTATTPQNIVFNWVNPGVVPIGTQYTIQLQQMPDVQADPNQVLNATSLYMLSQTISSTSYVYSLVNLGLQPGKKYAWRIIATDPLGITPFKNNGVSAASYFVYGNNAPVAVAGDKTIASNLNIITPSCDPAQTPAVIIGDHQDLNIAWLWREQLLSEQYFGSLDTLLTKHYTQMATGKGMISLGKYKLDFHRVTNNKHTGAEYANLTFSQNAPDQDFSLTYMQALAQKFVPGETYTVTVTGYDTKGSQIEQATSCQWQLQEADKQALPKLNISGRLVYGFDKSQYHGANNASITIQLTDTRAQTAISPDKNYVSATTDGNGNFKAQLTQLPADTGRKWLLVHINNPYYRQPDTSFLIKRVPPVVYSNGKNAVQATQDTLKIGDIQTMVYSNRLTVTVKKGFPKSLTNQDYDAQYGFKTNYNHDIFIDASTIDTMSRMPDGIKVTVFRKSKASDIPSYEGDGNTPKDTRSLVKINPISSMIKVAEGTTQGGASGKAQVTFNNLLCNFESGDVYYLQAQLPSDSTGTNQDLYAPQTAYAFKPAISNGPQAYHHTIDYNIISQKPPTAHVKGRVMYQWPSQPGVLHPYANKTVYIAEQYKAWYNNTPITDTCSLSSTQFTETIPGAGNTPYKKDWSLIGQNMNLEVGQVKTDANGYFDAEILVPQKMGHIDNVQITTPGTPCKPQVVTVNKPTQQPLLPNLHGNPVMAGNIFETNTFPGNTLNFNTTGALKTNVADNNLNRTLMGNLGSMRLTTPTLQIRGAISAGPSADDEGESSPEPANDSYVDRYFHIVGIPRLVNADSTSLKSAAHFVVQPFQTIDLGVITTNVNERVNYPIEIDTHGHNDILTGAKMVVYRAWTANTKDIPDGEGTLTHPKKPLISPVFKLDNTNTPVEWVIDTALLVASPTMNMGNRKLYLGDSKYQIYYSVLITPNPEGSGGYFKPVSTDIQGSDGYVEITPDNSRIAGRVINATTSKPLSGAMVTVTVGQQSITLLANKDGYFEVVNKQFANLSWQNNAVLKTQVNLNGYIQSSGDTAQSILATGKSYYKVLLMKPNKAVDLQTVDAVSGNPVFGYAMLQDSSVTDNVNITKKYHLFLSNTSAQTIKLYPNDPAYFEESVTIGAGQTVQPPVKMYKRHHRMQFRIYNPNMAVNANLFKILINNQPYNPVYHQNKTDGTISFDFENVSVNNYIIQVVNTAGQNFIPQQFNLKNEESRDFINYDIKVAPGAAVAGSVTLNNKVVPNARVYLDYTANAEPDYSSQSTGGGAAPGLLETRTDKNGYYSLKGIPVTSSYKIKMHATLDTSFTVNGASQEVNVVPATTTNASFALTAMPNVNINYIYNFPFSVESIEKINNEQYKVTGLVNLQKNNYSPFKPLDGTSKVRIANVILTLKNNIWQPVNNTIPLDAIASLKMKYLDQYNIKLESPNKLMGMTTPLALSWDGKKGAVNANASITDNSFNYPSSYLSFPKTLLGEPMAFYLFNPASPGNKSKPVIEAIYNGGVQNITYHLSDAGNDSLRFSFIGFADTKADPKNSYIDPLTKRIHLDVTFKGNIPHSSQGFVKVHVNNLELDGSSVKPVQGTDPIVVDLQSWKLYVKNWVVDPKLGGISSKNSYVATGIVDIPANTFTLRSDLFVLDDFDVQNIALGGGLVNLKGIKKEGTYLVYDEACGSDHAGHWRFSAISQGNQPVATLPLPAVPGKIQAANIGVNYLQLVSFNNENIINLDPQQTPLALYNNNKFTFLPASITSSPGSYELTGTASFAVPRMGNQAMGLIFTKANGAMDMNAGDFTPVHFEGAGYVQFTSDKGALFTPAKTPYITSIKGQVVEPGKFNPIPCTLTFGEPIGAQGNAQGADKGTIILTQGYKLKMDGDDEKKSGAGPNDLSLIIDDPSTNRMAVDPSTNDWGTLTFSGQMNDPKSNSPAKGGDPLQSQPTYLSFNVLGDLNVTSKEVKLDKIKTPVGTLSMVYDFPSHELRGSLHMKKVKFGQNEFTGDIQTNIGPKGLVLLGAGQLNTGTLFVDGFGVLNIGVVFANRDLTEDYVSLVTKYSKAKNGYCWLDTNRTNFKGFYLTGGLDVIDKHEKFNFVVASGYFNANLGIEASVGANFARKNYMVLLGAHGKVNAGLSAITGTTMSGGMAAHLTGVGSYSENGFAVNGDTGVTVKYEIDQYIPLAGTKHIGGQKGAKVIFGYGGGQKSYFDFSLAEDGDAVSCNNSQDIK